MITENLNSDPDYGELQKIGRFVFRISNNSPTSSNNNSNNDYTNQSVKASDMMHRILCELVAQNENLIQLLDDQTVSYMNTIQKQLNEIVSFTDECDYLIRLFPIINEMKHEIIEHTVKDNTICPAWIQQLPTLSAYVYIKCPSMNANNIMITLEELQSFIEYKLRSK